MRSGGPLRPFIPLFASYFRAVNGTERLPARVGLRWTSSPSTWGYGYVVSLRHSTLAAMLLNVSGLSFRPGALVFTQRHHHLETEKEDQFCALQAFVMTKMVCRT